MQNLLKVFFVTVFSSICLDSFGQKPNIPQEQNEKLLHDPGVYLNFMLQPENHLLITPQVWTYIDNLYFEGRYNYEDVRTFSLYGGRSFTLDTGDAYELIPMIGFSFGNFKGVSPGLAFIIQKPKIKGFLQSQFSFDLNENGTDFFFTWTSLTAKTYKMIYLGASSQIYYPTKDDSEVLFGPIMSVDLDPFLMEVSGYNFWNSSARTWALGLQYLL